MNLFTDPTLGPYIIFLFIIACMAGAAFIIIEGLNKATGAKPSPIKNVRYEHYIIVDGEVIYPEAVIDHIDTQA